MSDDLNQEIKIGADATGVEAGVSKAKRSLKDLGDTATRVGKEAAGGVRKVGDGSDKAAQSVDRATKNMAANLQRQIAAFEAGGTASREYQESLAKMRGANVAALKPLLDQLDAAKAKSEAASKAADKVSTSFDGMSIAAGLASRAIASIGIAASVQSYFQAADAVTALTNSLKLATGSTQAASTAYESLFTIAQRSRVNFVELGNTYASISRATGELGVSQSRMLKVTESIANAMTISGGSAQGMNAALTQLSQGMASGTLRGEELNSILEQAPRLAKALADGLGVPIGKLREMGQAGEITSQQIVRALESQSEVLSKEVTTATITLGQAFTQLSNSGTKAVGEFDKASGASTALAQAISSIAGAVDTMGAAFKNNETAVKSVMGALTGAAALATLAAIPRAIGAIGAAITGLSVVLAANPAVLALLGVGAVVGGGLAAVNSYSKTERGIKEAVASLEEANVRSEAALERAMAGGRTAGADNIRKTIEERKKAIRDLNAEIALLNNAGLDNRAEEARLAAGTEQYRAQKQAAEELAGIKQKLSGVDKDYLPTLNKLYQQYKDGNITLTEYQGLVAKLAEDNYKAADGSKAAASAAKEELNTFQSLVAAIQAKIKANAEEIAYSGRLTESDKLRIQLQVQLEAGTKKLSAAHRAHAEALLAKLGAQEKDIAAIKRAVGAYQELIAIQEELDAAYVAESKARESGRQAVTDYVAGIDQSNEALEYEISLMGKSESERQTLIEQYRIELDLKRRIAEVNKNQGFTQPQRDEEIARLTGAADRAKAGVATRALYDDIERANRKAQDELNRYIEDTQRGLGDAIETAIFDGSKAGGEKMREVLQEALLRKPLRMVIDGVLNQVTGGALQLLGLGGGGGGVMGGGGSSSGLGTLLTIGQQAYNAYNGTGMAGAAWAGIQNLFGFGTQAAMASNTAMIASSYGGGAASIAAAQNASLAAGGSATGGAGLGAWGAGGIATMIMLGVINALGGMRSERMVGSGLAGTLGNGTALTPWQEWREGGTLVSGSSFATHNPLQELESRRAELQRLRDNGQGESNYAVGLQAIVTDLEKTTKGLAEQTAVFDREINKGYKTYRDNVVKMADSLGLAGSSIEDFAYTLGAQDLNLQGLKPEEVQAKIQEVFGKAGDAMAKEILGSWREVTDTVVNTYVAEQMTQANDGRFVTETTTSTRMEYVASVYAKTGETAIQTLERLSTSFNTLNETADALGFGIQQGSLALADFSDKFIEAFGGLEKFSSTTSAYMQAYYSDEERRQALLRSGARQANRLGLDGVTAASLEQLGRDGIRAFVTGLIEGGGTPEEIRDAMDLANFLSPAFESLDAQTPVAQELSNVVDELTQSYQNAIKSLTSDRDSLAVEVLRAQGKEAEAKALERSQYLAQFAGLDETRRKEIETLYDANVATRAFIEGIKAAAQAQLDALAKLRTDSLALIDTAAGKTDQALAAYERAADKERERLQGVIDTTRAVFQAAEDGAKSFFGEVDAVAKFQGQQGRDFISQALASVAAGGALPDGKELSDAIAAVGKDFSTTQYASQAEADFQRLVVANQLKGLKEASGDQLTTAEDQLDALNKQVEWAREQVSALRGIDTKLKDLPTAIADLIAAYNNESQTRANVGAKAIIGTGNAIYDKKTGTGTTSSGAYFDASDMADVARDVIAANGDAGKASVLDALEGKGFTMAQYDQMFGLPAGTLEAEAKALGKPIYHSGTTYVPQTGFALLQQGEAVIPAAYNPWANGAMGGSDQAVVAELRAVKAELLEIRRQNDNLNYQAKRTADATNGQGEAPMLTEAT